MTTRRKKKVGWVILAIGLMLVIGAVVVIPRLWRSHIRRLYAFLPYLNALTYHAEEVGVFPQSLRDLELAYNAYDLRRVPELPVPPDGRRPLFRPIGSLKDGMYLTFVETAPTGFSLRRWVAYASPDGQSVKYESVWKWKLENLIAEDDRLRWVSRVPASQPTTGQADR